MILTKRFLKELKWLFIFKLLIDIIYFGYISKLYSYSGFFLDFNVIKYIEGSFFTLIIYYLLDSKRWNKLYFSLIFIFLSLIIPIITLYGLRNEPRVYFYIIILSFILFLILLVERKIKFKYIKRSGEMALFISLFFTFIVLAHYIFTKGINVINFQFDKVYQFREKFGDVDDEGIFGYLNSWVTKVFNPLLIIWAFQSKKIGYTLLFVIIQILLFGLSGHKAVLFVLIPLIFLYIIREKISNPLIIFKSGILLILMTVIYTELSENILGLSLFIRRAFFVPADLNFVYLDFFSRNDFVYWSNSVFNSFLDNPYLQKIPILIGESLGKENMYANIGIFGSGYMQLGIIGIIIYIIIISFFINLLHNFQAIPKWVLNGIILIPLSTIFSSSDLITSFITHGFLVAVIMIFLFNEKSIE